MLGHTERFCHAVGLQDGESHLYRHISESSLVPHLYRMLFASRAVAGMASEGPNVEFVALYVHMSAGRCLQKIHAPHGSGFAGAGRADDNQLLALPYLQINVLQNVEVAEILVYILQFNHRFHPQVA